MKSYSNNSPHDTGVIDEDVNYTEFPHGLIDQFRAIFGFTDIRFHAQDGTIRFFDQVFDLTLGSFRPKLGVFM